MDLCIFTVSLGRSAAMEERIEFSVRRIQFSLWQLEFHSIIGIMEKKLHHCDSVATMLFFGRWWWLWPKVAGSV